MHTRFRSRGPGLECDPNRDPGFLQRLRAPPRCFSRASRLVWVVLQRELGELGHGGRVGWGMGGCTVGVVGGGDKLEASGNLGSEGEGSCPWEVPRSKKCAVRDDKVMARNRGTGFRVGAGSRGHSWGGGSECVCV